MEEFYLNIKCISFCCSHISYCSITIKKEQEYFQFSFIITDLQLQLISAKTFSYSKLLKNIYINHIFLFLKIKNIYLTYQCCYSTWKGALCKFYGTCNYSCSHCSSFSSSLLLWLQVSKSLLKAVPTSETMSEAVIERPNFWKAWWLDCLVREQAPNAATRKGFWLKGKKPKQYYEENPNTSVQFRRWWISLYS